MAAGARLTNTATHFVLSCGVGEEEHVPLTDRRRCCAPGRPMQLATDVDKLCTTLQK